MLDFAGSHLSTTEKQIASNLDPVREIRLAQFTPEVSRVVIDLREPARYSIKGEGSTVTVPLQAQVRHLAPTTRTVRRFRVNGNPKTESAVRGVAAEEAAVLEAGGHPGAGCRAAGSSDADVSALATPAPQNAAARNAQLPRSAAVENCLKHGTPSRAAQFLHPHRWPRNPWRPPAADGSVLRQARPTRRLRRQVFRRADLSQPERCGLARLLPV